jgi:hypothetical protein
LPAERLLQTRERCREAFFGEFIFKLQRPQQQIIGVQIRGCLIFDPFDFRELQIRLDCGNDAFAESVLQFEHIGHLALEAIGPYVRSRRGVYELCREAQPIAAPPHAAFKHITHAKLASDLAHVDRLSFVGE